MRSRSRTSCVAAVLRTVRGAANVYPEPLTSSQYVNVRIDRERAARYGLSVAAVQEVIGTAIGERNVTLTLEGRRRFPVRVRYAPEFRDDAQALGNVLIATPTGQQLPLAQVVTIEQARGPATISSENGLLLATVLLNVQNRDIGGFVEEAKAAVAAGVPLPAGYFIGWSGRYENQVRARERLQIVVPLALVVIRTALLHVSLGARGRARAAGGAIRADRRRLSPVVSAITSRSPSGSGSSRSSARPSRPAS